MQSTEVATAATTHDKAKKCMSFQYIEISKERDGDRVRQPLNLFLEEE